MARGGYWLHTWVTVWEVLLGFFIGSGVGLLLGTIISQFRIIEATLRIYLVAIQSLPKIALAPIIVLWFGFGLTSKVVIICLLTFFPLLINSMAGFKAVDPERLELMRALGANPWQIFWKVRLPSAMPYIFAGLDMAAVFAVVGAVVGEFVGAQRGLGTLILSMNAQMDIAGTSRSSSFSPSSASSSTGPARGRAPGGCLVRRRAADDGHVMRMKEFVSGRGAARA